MTKLRGEDVVLGLGMEDPAARGTRVAPQIYLPARTPSGIAPVLDKVLIKESKGTKIASQGSEIVKKRVEGEVEFNVRVESLGFLLRSLLGAVSSGVKGGETVVYDHEFSVLAENPQHPSLSLALHQPGVQDYDMPLGLVSSLEMKMTPDELVTAKAALIAKTVTEQNTPYSPTFDDADYYFRQYDVTIKIADNLAGLAGANALDVKEFSFSLVNNGRPDYNIGELTPGDMLALVMEPKGSFMADIEDTDLHDVFVSGDYKAMSITLKRSDVTIGVGSNPTVAILMPKVSFETWSPDRPIDEIATQNVDYQAHYDETEEYAVKITLTNERENYNAATES